MITGINLLIKQASISNYISGDEIKIKLPIGSIVKTIQIDTSNSELSKFFNITIIHKKETLTVCKLENYMQMDMMLFGKKDILMDEIIVKFTPHINSVYYGKGVLIFDDEIVIRILGGNEEEEEGGNEYSRFFFDLGGF
jgi:hypothetical protein|tara:strand:+ start:11 stop:427 length:417 start_codon:yes stop_codon:yes gene_type:complete